MSLHPTKGPAQISFALWRFAQVIANVMLILNSGAREDHQRSDINAATRRRISCSKPLHAGRIDVFA